MAVVLNRQPYTCICCQVAFSKPEHQRAHYKTDWHRYNLKRQVAELPPVTALVYQEKVVAVKEAEDKEKDSKQAQYCKVCRKTFSNTNSLQSHERSRKHKEMELKAANTPSVDPPLERVLKDDGVSKMEEDKEDREEGHEEDKAEDDEEDGEALEVTECLFCPNYEDNMESSLAHMGKVHGFFIPDLEYLVDLEGLIEYLGAKVGIGNVCLYCNERGKTFHTVEAVQHHMIDKCHCKMMFEGDAALEYAEYYDYTKSYPKNDDIVDDQSDPSTNQSLKVNDDLELVLPSGVTVGHRYYKNYYRQHIPVGGHRKGTSVGRVMARYRAIGWNLSCDDHMRKQRDEKWALKMKKEKLLKVSLRANKMQFHLRPQVIF